MANPEKQKQEPELLDQTLDSITSERDTEKRNGMKQALAGIMNFLPKEKQKKPDSQDLQSAMKSRIESETSTPDIAKNPDVIKIKTEMLSRIQNEHNPEKLLKDYTEMRGMLDGAIGGNKASQAKTAQEFQSNLGERQQKNELANLDFIELGKKFREALLQAQEQAAQSRLNNQKKFPPDGQPIGSEEKAELASNQLKNSLGFA